MTSSRKLLVQEKKNPESLLQTFHPCYPHIPGSTTVLGFENSSLSWIAHTQWRGKQMHLYPPAGWILILLKTKSCRLAPAVAWSEPYTGHLTHWITALLEHKQQKTSFPPPLPWPHSNFWNNKLAALLSWALPTDRCGGVYQGQGRWIDQAIIH